MTTVVVQSRRIVKPGPSDTNVDPPARNSIRLSSADFRVFNYHVRLLFAFQAPTPPTSELEEGMANVLTLFRVYAGTLIIDHNGRLAIDLSDQGVVFTEALADGTLADAMPFDPAPSLLQFLPPVEGVPELLLIQITRFACGGLVIGVAFHHLVGDGVTIADFLNCWAAMVRGGPINSMPVHDRSLLMARHPPRPVFEHLEIATLASIQNNNRDLVVKNFRFSGELVNRVRARASQNAEKPYSRYVSVLAHAWRCVSIARGLHGDVVTRACIAVDGRNRLSPPLPAGYVGNVVFGACAETTVRELNEEPLQFVADLIQNAIRRVDDDYIRSAMDRMQIIEGNGGAAPPLHSSSVRVFNPHIITTSLLRFPLYEFDFGEGKPLCVASCMFNEEGMLRFLPASGSDGGMHITVGLFQRHMASFQEKIYDI